MTFAPGPDPSTELPPGLALLWGRRDRGRRGPRPRLTVEAIVEAAVATADEGGFDAVSMASVAARLGFTTMSLYRYVSSKDELLGLMWDASARGAETLVLVGDDWRARLRGWVMVQREGLDRHPWLTEMSMPNPPMGPSSLAFVERGLEALDDTGLGDDDKLALIGLLSSYTLSEARLAHDAQRAASGEPGHPPVPPASFEAVLRLLVDESSFPRLHRLAWSRELAPPDEEEAFARGIELILDGVQALVDRAVAREP